MIAIDLIVHRCLPNCEYCEQWHYNFNLAKLANGQKQAVTDSEFAPQQFSIFDKKKSTKDMVTNNTDYFSSSNACLGPSNRDLWITNFQHVIHTLRYGDRLGQN